MLLVTVPAFVITLVLYAIIGMQFAGQELDVGAIEEITMTLSEISGSALY